MWCIRRDSSESWGGIVDYVLIGWDENVSVDPFELHKEAAIFTAKTLIDRHTQHLVKYLRSGKENIYQIDDLLPDERKGIQIRPKEAKGQQISLDKFLVPQRMWVRQEDMHKHPSLTGVQHLFDSLDKYREKPFDGLHVVTSNYYYVFSDPPYPLSLREGKNSKRIPQEEIMTLFEAINTQLFGESFGDIIVYEWATDWIDYLCFYEGYGWGSYLWTVYNPKTRGLVGITASAGE